jgi:hypothetical protein
MSRDMRVNVHRAELARVVVDGAKKTVDQVSAKTLANAIRIVPIKSGALRASLRREVSKDGREAKIGSSLKYARHVEEGTSRMAAQPYLKPALYQARGSV